MTNRAREVAEHIDGATIRHTDVYEAWLDWKEGL